MDAEARQALRELFEIQLNDRCDVWQMDSDGSYSKRAPTAGACSSGCQETMIAAAARRIARSLEIADLGAPLRFTGYRNNFKQFCGD